jgi:hypothetical protein
MKIKKSKLKNIIENFLRENPYDDEEKSKKMDQDLKDSEKELERDRSISHRSKKIRKQGVKIKPRMFKAMMKDYRKLVLFLIDARDKLEKSNPDRAKLILDIRKIYDAAKDIQNGNNADALAKFNAVAKSITGDLLIKEKRARKDFIEIQKTIKQAVEAGPAAADKIDAENFLLSPTQDELKTKKKAEEEKPKDASKIKDSKKQNINDIQDMLIKLGATDYENNKLTADGVWGAKSRSAFSKFLVAIKDSYKGTEAKQTTLTATTIDFDKLSTGKKLEKKGVWQQAAMEMSGKKDQYVAANNVLSEILAMDIEVNMKGGSAKEEEKKKQDSKYKIENIYSELNKVFKKEKAAEVDLGKIPLGAFNKMGTGNTISKNLFFGTPKTYEKPPKAISWLGSTWKDNHHSRDDVNVYFEDNGQNTDIIFTDGTSGGAVGGVLMYRIAIDGIGAANAIIKGYVAVKEKTGKIFLMSVERATKEGHIKSAGEQVTKK